MEAKLTFEIVNSNLGCDEIIICEHQEPCGPYGFMITKTDPDRTAT